MRSSLILLLALPPFAHAAKKPGPPIVVDTPDGPSLVAKDGTVTPLAELNQDEIDALGVGDPALLKKGAAADERRRAAWKIFEGCEGEIKCWREGMARWEAAGEKGKPPKVVRENKSEETYEPAGLSREDRIKEMCLDYGNRSKLSRSERDFYDRHCI